MLKTFFAVLALASLSCSAFAGEGAAGMKLIAHRGYSALYPENTLPAIEAVLKEPDLGTLIGGIEIDIRLTKDNAMAVFHDGHIMIGEVKTPVDKIDYAELVERSKARFKGEKVPLFDEVLAAVAHRAPLYVELKGGGDKAVYIDSLVKSVEAYKPNGDIVIHSFGVDLLEIAHARLSVKGVRFAVLVVSAKKLAELKPEFLAKMDFINPSFKAFLEDPAAFASCGKPLNVWTVNKAQDIEALKKSRNADNVSGIITDDLKLVERLR